MLRVPHGGTLVSQIVDPEEAARFVAAADRPTVALNAEQAYDVVNIGTGVFSPLRGFLGRAEGEAVVPTGRLHEGAPVLRAGPVELLAMPDNPHARYALTPRETRVLFAAKGWRTVVGFQTRNVPHLGHESVPKAALTPAGRYDNRP